MPGSPYLEDPPKGLITWPVLLRVMIPTLIALAVAAWWTGFLLEFLILLTITGLVLFIVRQ